MFLVCCSVCRSADLKIRVGVNPGHKSSRALILFSFQRQRAVAVKNKKLLFLFEIGIPLDNLITVSHEDVMDQPGSTAFDSANIDFSIAQIAGNSNRRAGKSAEGKIQVLTAIHIDDTAGLIDPRPKIPMRQLVFFISFAAGRFFPGAPCVFTPRRRGRRRDKRQITLSDKKRGLAAGFVLLPACFNRPLADIFEVSAPIHRAGAEGKKILAVVRRPETNVIKNRFALAQVLQLRFFPLISGNDVKVKHSSNIDPAGNRPALYLRRLLGA